MGTNALASLGMGKKPAMAPRLSVGVRNTYDGAGRRNVRRVARRTRGMGGLGSNRRREVLHAMHTRPDQIGTPADASPYADLDRFVTGTRRVSLGTQLFANSTRQSRTDLDRLVDSADGVNGLGEVGSWLSSGKLNSIIGAVASVVPGGSTIANAILPQPQQQVQQQAQAQTQAAAPAVPSEDSFIKGVTKKELITYSAIGGVALLTMLTLVFVAARK